jgi:nucleolar MIF4G domain-containing protein 1
MLKNRAERDTVRVLTECCGNEKSYNPFYSLLASRMCEYQPQCKFSFQLAFWDIFKQFDDLKARKVANLAKLLYHLVAKHQSLRLHVLKVIDMAPAEISENALIFLTVFFSTIFESFDDPAEVHQLVSNGLHSGRTKADTDEIFASDGGDDADSEGLRESLSIFFLQTLKSSPKNKKKSKFRANFKAAVKACESDGLDSMV